MLSRARRLICSEVSLNCSASYVWGCRGVEDLPVFRGACTVSHSFPNLRSLLNASDAAMYEPKNSGKNRVACYLVAKEQGSVASVQAPEGYAN
jgi:hypothetical protein